MTRKKDAEKGDKSNYGKKGISPIKRNLSRQYEVQRDGFLPDRKRGRESFRWGDRKRGRESFL